MATGRTNGATPTAQHGSPPEASDEAHGGRTPAGLPRDFVVLAGGQVGSLLGTLVSGTGVSIVAFLETGSVWWLSMLYLAARIPALVVSPHAGRLVDRRDRRTVLLAADTAAGIATAAALGLHLVGALALWHLVVLAVVGSIANAYQEPAFQAAIPALVPTERLDRAHGLVHLGPALGLLGGPALAGLLVAGFGLAGVLVADLVSFLLAVVATVLVSVPDRRAAAIEESAIEESVEASVGGAGSRDGLRTTWAYLDGPRRGLRRLLGVSALANLVLSMVNVLLFALLLPLVGEAGAGGLLSLGGAAMLLTAATISARGLPGRRVRTLAASFVLVGAGCVVTGLRPSPWLAATGIVLTLAGGAVAGAALSTVFQAAVPEHWQGRLMALRRVSGEALVPLGVLAAAPLVERVVDPAMAPGGALAGSVGQVLGVGPGRGVGLVFVATGACVVAIGAWLARDRVANDLDRVVPAAHGGDVPTATAVVGASAASSSGVVPSPGVEAAAPGVEPGATTAVGVSTPARGTAGPASGGPGRRRVVLASRCRQRDQVRSSRSSSGSVISSSSSA